jgi:glycosyltransferase involved in cell wall biosynthesis
VVRTLRDGPAIVSTEHNVWRSHNLLTRSANAATAPFDRVRWAVSSEVVESMWPRWRRRAEVLVHGIPLRALQARRHERAAARTAQGWSDGDVVVVTVANLRAHKDHRTLFAAARSALAEEPSLRFACIGQGPLEDELRAHLATLGMGDRCTMLGYHDDPAAVLAGADLFALSSRHEGLPISLLEAMAVGVCPVATAVGGIPEVLTSERDGLLVPSGDPAALARAFVRLARDPAGRARLAAAAAERAADFDIERTARTIEARYAELVDGR